MQIFIAVILSLLGAAIIGTVVFILYSKHVKAQKASLEAEIKSLSETIEAQTARLSEKTDELARVKEEHKRFQSQISHELRVPVSIVQGYADIIGDGLVDDRETEKQYMRKISEKTGELTQMIQDMLIVSRYDNDRIKLELRKCDISSIIGQTVSDLRAKLKAGGISSDLQLPDEPIFVNADSVKLKQVFYNIMDNSLKYMGREGSVTITCTYNDGRVYIVFRDNGEGMKSEDAKHVFERSFRGENAVNGVKNGTGLGMYITDMFIRMHGGEISVMSETGEGMTVFIELPAELN